MTNGTLKEPAASLWTTTYSYDHAQTFTIDQIRDRWLEYKNAHGYRVLRGGKWKLYMRKPDLSGGATRCEMVEVSKHMSFPKYLEGIK